MRASRDHSFFLLALSLFFLPSSLSPFLSALPDLWIHLRVNEFRGARTGTPSNPVTNVHVENRADASTRACGATRGLSLRDPQDLDSNPVSEIPCGKGAGCAGRHLYRLASTSFRFSRVKATTLTFRRAIICCFHVQLFSKKFFKYFN